MERNDADNLYEYRSGTVEIVDKPAENDWIDWNAITWEEGDSGRAEA